jgi:nitroimidazol reductase NimA-like FMN-containing flavoprotein (pyridoxamine 5'-phosphate oxidase superfamily)
MDTDRNGLEVLEEDECLALLGSATLGRIAITSGALPVILPVNFVLVDRTVLFRTGRGTKLDAATHGAVVAFEADDCDPVDHTGWSVNVIGVARDLSEVVAHMTFDTTRIPRWAPGPDGRVVAVEAEIVTGRRLRHDAAALAGS